MTAQAAIYVTAWLAMVGWYVGVMGMLYRPSSRFPVRTIWAAACSFQLLHVAAAFHWVHDWTHAAAFEYTRQIGGFGEGIYVNYFFTGLWLLDAVWLGASPESYRQRPRWLTIAIHVFLLFIVFNAMVVFGGWFTRGLFAAFAVGFAVVLSTSRQNKLTP